MVQVLKGPYERRATKQTVTPFEKGAWDNLVIGFDSGLKDTSLSYLNTVNTLSKAKQQYENAGESEITEEQYNDPNFDLRVEGIEWEPHLTYEMLYNAKEAQVTAQRFAMAEGGFFSMKTLGSFGGAMIDPVNLIPIPVGFAGKSIWKTASLIGAANAGIELAISPIGKQAYSLRGMEGEYSVLRNMAFAAVLGGALGGGAAAIGRSFDYARAMNTPENAGSVLARTVPQSQKLNQRIKQFIETNKFKSPEQINKNTIDFSAPGRHYIDTDGVVTKEQPYNPVYARVDIDEVGNIKISGDMETIVRASTDIVENKNVDSLITFGSVTKNKKTLSQTEQLDTRTFEDVITNEGGKTNFDAKWKLDDQQNSGLVFDFDNEFQVKGIRKIVKDENNKIIKEEKLDPQDVDKILDDIDPDVQNTLRSETQKPKESADDIEAKARDERTAESESLALEIKNKGDVDAHLENINNKSLQNVRSELNKINNLENAEVNRLLYQSMFAQIPEAKLRRLGYEWDEATQTLKEVAPAKDLTKAEKYFLEDITAQKKKLTDMNKLDEANLKSFNCMGTKI